MVSCPIIRYKFGKVIFLITSEFHLNALLYFFVVEGDSDINDF